MRTRIVRWLRALLVEIFRPILDELDAAIARIPVNGSVRVERVEVPVVVERIVERVRVERVEVPSAPVCGYQVPEAPPAAPSMMGAIAALLPKREQRQRTSTFNGKAV